MVHNRLLCTGDPILDIYIDEDGSVSQKRGGAENIYQNIIALLLGKGANREVARSVILDFAYPFPDRNRTDIRDVYTIVKPKRQHHIHNVYKEIYSKDIHLVSPNERKYFYDPGQDSIYQEIIDFKPNVLVLGDYNKGSLNCEGHQSDSERPLPPIGIAIADSRYRSLHPSWLSTSNVKIWHATGKEYDYEWGKQFDYIFHTDGPRPVKIYKKNVLLTEIKVPENFNIANTCGAGDTFTATLAAKLLYKPNIDDIRMTKIAKFAIEVCQEVISMPYTATTTKRIL